MGKKEIIILTLIFLLALFLRIYRLDTVPSGFHQDEVVNSYVGKFILTNGTDLYGNRLPFLYFDKWGDFPPVLPMYFIGLGSLIFGNTVFGARIITAIFGTVTVLIIFFWAKKVFKDYLTALFSALTLAINPWHIAFSRVGAEGIIVIFFYSLALFFFNFGSQKKDFIKNVLASVLFFMTYFLYPGYRIIIPLTFIGLLTFNYFKNKRLSGWWIFCLLISTGLTLYIGITSWGQGRYNQTSIISYINSQKDYFNKFIFNENSVFVARLFNNKFIYIGREFMRQFFWYFSPVYLFVDGGKPSWFSFPNSGLFYLSNLFLIVFLISYYLQIKKSDLLKNWLGLIFFLLLVSVIPAALTNELSPNMHRSLLMIIFVTLMVGAGFQIAKSVFLRKRLFLGIFGAIILIEFIYFFHNYFQHVSLYTSIARSDGNKEAALYLKSEHNKYNKSYMFASGWFPIYYLYFSGNYHADLVGRIQKGMRMDNLDNISFVNRDCQYSQSETAFSDFIDKKSENLIIFSSTCTPPADRRLAKIGEIKNGVNIPVYLVYKTILTK